MIQIWIQITRCKSRTRNLFYSKNKQTKPSDIHTYTHTLSVLISTDTISVSHTSCRWPWILLACVYSDTGIHDIFYHDQIKLIWLQSQKFILRVLIPLKAPVNPSQYHYCILLLCSAGTGSCKWWINKWMKWNVTSLDLSQAVLIMYRTTSQKATSATQSSGSSEHFCCS